MKYQRYAKYKDSSIEWIEEIPEHWDATRARWLFREINERSTNGDETLLSVSEYYGVKPREDIIDPGDFITNATSLEGYKKCKKNDLVMNIMLAWKGALGITDYNGIVSPSYNVYRPLKPKDAKYLHYLFRTKVYADIFRKNSTGIIDSRLRLYSDSFASVKVIRPSLEDQISICKFLDVQLRRVEGLIISHEKMIRLLKEKRQAIITHAVTKGLDPNVPMKDSGIEWIGEIPEQWKIDRIKHTSYVKGRVGWKGLTSEEYLDEGYAYLVTGQDFFSKYISWESCFQVDKVRYDDDPYIQLVEGDLLLTKDGTIGKLAVVKNLQRPACLNSGIFLVRPINSYLSDYLYWVLSSKVFSGFYEFTSIGSTIQHLYQNTFENFCFPIPPISGQTKIVQYLENRITEIDLLMKKQQQMIELLQEHKTSLITQAVTGKIDVRGSIQEVKEPAGQTP